jgi:tetratricopeptide (TPR) repeat protein
MIGYTELQELHPDRALSWFEEALQFEPTGVVKAIIKSNLASAWLHLHKLDRAEEAARAALRLAEAAVGPDAPDTLAPQAVLADIHFQRRELAEAEPIYRRLLFLAEKFWGPDVYEVGIFSGSLGMIYLHQHRFSQARLLLERSAALTAQRAGDAATYDVLVTRVMIGLTYAGEGRSRQANEVFERALGRAEAELGSGTVALARLLLRAGLAKLQMRDREQGKQWCERAIAIFEAQDGAAWGEAVEALHAYLGALRDAGDARHARRFEPKLKSLRR